MDSSEVAVLIVRVIVADAETPGTVSATVPETVPLMPAGQQRERRPRRR